MEDVLICVFTFISCPLYLELPLSRDCDLALEAEDALVLNSEKLLPPVLASVAPYLQTESFIPS